MQCCTCSKWVHLKYSLLALSRFKTLDSSHSWSCLPYFFWGFLTDQHCILFLGLLPLVYLHCATQAHLAPPLLMQRSRPTLAFKPLILLLPTLYLFRLHPPHRLIFLAVFLYLLLPLPSKHPQASSMECWRSSCQEH